MTTSDRTHLAAPPLPPGRSSLVVTGFMGTGKTEAGRRAARLLGRPFVDLDAVIERRTGRSIAEVFQQEGEDAFRSLERTAVADAARLSGAVIATGGGAPLDRTSFARLAEDAVVAVLTCEEPELLRRLRHDRDRPLLTHDPPGRITLLAERADAYAAAGGSLDTTALDPEQAATALVERFRSTTSAATEVRIAAGSSTVVVGPGTVAELGFELRRAVPEATAAAVVMDEAVEDTAGASVEEALRRAGMPVLARAVVPAGEGAKRVETTAGLWNTFLACGLDPTGVVVAVTCTFDGVSSERSSLPLLSVSWVASVMLPPKVTGAPRLIDASSRLRLSVALTAGIEMLKSAARFKPGSRYGAGVSSGMPIARFVTARCAVTPIWTGWTPGVLGSASSWMPRFFACSPRSRVNWRENVAIGIDTRIAGTRVEPSVV